VKKQNRMLSFKLRESTLKELKEVADRRDESVSHLVREALKGYLEAEASNHVKNRSPERL